jgi:hypothetical protein
MRVRELKLHGARDNPSLGYTRVRSNRWLDKKTSEWQHTRNRSFESYNRVRGLLLVVSVTSNESNHPVGAISNKDMNCLMECLTAVAVARVEGG